MDGILSFIKGTLFWIFVIGFVAGAYIGGSFMGYFVYVDSVKHISELNTPEYKVQFSHNMFYKLDKWSNPDDFRDVLELEKAKRLREFKENESDISKDTKSRN